MQIVPPVSMRADPTALETTGTASDYGVRQGSGVDVACNSVPTMSGDSQKNVFVVNLPVASGLTANAACLGRSIGSDAHLSFFSEL